VWDTLADAPVPAAIVEADGRVSHANEAIARLVGAKLPEALGRPWQEFTALRDLPAAEEMIRRVLAGEVQRYTVRRRWVREDGRQISVELQVGRREDRDGRPSLLVLAVDRTGSDEAEVIALERFREAFDNSPIGMALLDMDRRFLEVNQAQVRIAATSRENLIGRCVDDFIDQEDLPASYADVGRLEDGGTAYDAMRHGWRANGEEAWLLVSSTLLRNHDDRPVSLFVQLVDVTPTVVAERELHERLGQLTALSVLGRLALSDASVEELDGAATEAVLAGLPAVGCGVLERHGADLRVACWRGAGRGSFVAQHMHATDQLTEASRRPGVEVVRFDRRDSASPAVAAVVASEHAAVVLVACLQGELEKEGGPDFLLNAAHVLGAARHRRATTDQLRTLATHDALTGLANRRLLGEQLPLAVARARRNPHPTALLLIDLDDFKLVNDSLGHAAGDLVLQQIATRLRRAVRTADLVVRMGGDEFLVVAESVDGEEFGSLRTRIRQLVSAPIEIGEQRVVVGATVAHVLSSGAEEPEVLLNLVDEHLYRDKFTRG